MRLRIFADKSPTALQAKLVEFAMKNEIIKAFEPKKRGDMFWGCLEYL